MPRIPKAHASPVPTTADLNDPLYYLANFETVMGWVRSHHGDLLLEEERHLVDNLMALPFEARALVARMVMRSGDGFRVEKLHYPELGRPIPELMGVLADHGWIDPKPAVSVTELFRLYTLQDLRAELAQQAAELGLIASASKSRLKQAMSEAFPDTAPVDAWLPDFDTWLVRLQHMALFDRLRLMFFGNLRQTWSDFVLVELGHQQYETVPFTSDARAFDKREDVDRYLLLHHCREHLDQGESPEIVWEATPEASDNAWLESRRGRLLFELARQSERNGNVPLALEAYRKSRHREARLRYLRLLERQKRFQEAWDEAALAAEAPRNDSEVQGLKRLISRLGKKLNQPSEPAQPRPVIPSVHLTLGNPEGHSVEWRVMEHMQTSDAPVAYVENTLITGLFGLLCWPAIFAPIPCAFFHPFHNGPVDLYRDDFFSRREAQFKRCLKQLKDGSWKQAIRHTWQEKYGIASPFVVWPVLSESLLELALHCVPAEHLGRLFDRLMVDLRQHRSGFPDLIRFVPDHPDPAQRYEMIEVKGPGDRLQDHQVRWLEYCVQQGIPVSVCYVGWAEPGS